MNQISRAFLSPTWRASKAVPQPASTEPTFGPTCPNCAVSAAIVRSHSVASTLPPPMAKPLTRAMTGLGTSRISPCNSSICYHRLTSRLLDHVHTAGDRDGLAGDEFSVVRGEQGNNAGIVIGFAHSL